MSLLASDRDPSADPGVDFYRFANGGWLDNNPIPRGYGSWGSFEEVQKATEEHLRTLLEATEPGDLLGDYFAAGLDLEAIEAAGLEPIAPLLATTDVRELHRNGIFALFSWSVQPDHDDPDLHLMWLSQGGALGLPDRETYFAEDAADLRAAYVAHIAAQLGHVGGDPARAADVLAFETRMAELHWRAEQQRDTELVHNRVARADLPAWLEPYLLAEVESVNLENPRLFAELPAVLESTDAETLRAYLQFTVVRSTASALPAQIDDEDFAFYGRRIRGQQEPHERVKRVIDAIGQDIGEALAERYVMVHFPLRRRSAPRRWSPRSSRRCATRSARAGG